ncbi:MAG: SPFH domain-containing protein, partial [Opitutaceae bacterium]
MTFVSSVAAGFFLTFVGTFFLILLGRIFQLWRVLPERTVVVYTFFGKVVGQVEEPGLFFPIAHFGPRALLFPFFGKAYTVRTLIHQAYLRNQLVNSEEGAPMGVGIWFEMFVNNPKAYLFQNSDPLGSLKANVATAVVKQLSNLKLDVLLENRDALSRKVREEVTPTSSQWGFNLGSTYIRKVAFRDQGMIAEIQRKVVNRLRQVTAAMRQAGENEVAIIHSEADKKASQRLGQAQAVRPQVVGG